MLRGNKNKSMENIKIKSHSGILTFFCALVAALLVAVDQLTKYFVLRHLKPVGSIEVIKNFFFLSYVENRGAAFGFLAGHRWLFMPLTAIGCFALLAFLLLYKKHGFLSRTAVTLVLAGGIGNMIDRIALGYVVDFINFPFFGYVFNIADCCVVVGACCFIIAFALQERKEHKKTQAEKESADVEKTKNSATGE